MTLYTPRWFAPHEVLPDLSTSVTWDTLDPELRKLLDDRILVTADDVRDLLRVPVSINNYGYGGERQWCGLRTPACKIGAPRSYHRRGMAVDMHASGMDAETARGHIKRAIAQGQLPHIGGIETGVSWVHCDCRDRINGKVVYFAA